MEKLAQAQRPESLFITCSDSRIVPNLITSSGPGDLFTARNVGNIIAADRQDASVEAAIAFAVNNLHVTSIVVCGHSSCGAMHALLGDAPSATTGDEHLDTWLAHGLPTLEAFQQGRHPVARSAASAGFGTVDQLSMVNVAVQVHTLVNHPILSQPHRQGRLNVIGLFYDISSAEVLRVMPMGVSTRLDVPETAQLSGHGACHHQD